MILPDEFMGFLWHEYQAVFYPLFGTSHLVDLWARLMRNEPEYVRAHPARREILDTDGKHLIPVRLFGDDGSLGKRSSMTLHHSTPCCSEASSTRRSKILLFALDRKAINDTTDKPVLRATALSFGVALAGVYPSRTHDGKDFVGARTNLRGPIAGPNRLIVVLAVEDWKQAVERFHLPHYYNCYEMCHLCKATKDGDLTYQRFHRDAACFQRLRTHEEYVMSGSATLSPQLGTPGFHSSCIAPEMMHCGPWGFHIECGACALLELWQRSWSDCEAAAL